MNISHSSYNCPHCGSENTRKLSLINRDGISKSDRRGFVGNQSVRVRGNHQTASSQMASAPIHPSTILTRDLTRSLIIVILLTIVVRIFLKALWILFLPIATLYFIMKTISKHNSYSKDYPELFRRWNNGYECQRCEKVFTLQ